MRDALATRGEMRQSLPMSGDHARPRCVGIGHMGLSVTDLDRSIAFYSDVLGATVVRGPYDGDRPSFAGRMALIRFGSLSVDVYQHVGNRNERFDPAHTGLDHLALAAATFEELEAWARWLDEHQVARSPIRDIYGVGSMFDFTDPDGIQFEFFYLDVEGLRRSPIYGEAASTSDRR